MFTYKQKACCTLILVFLSDLPSLAFYTNAFLEIVNLIVFMYGSYTIIICTMTRSKVHYINSPPAPKAVYFFNEGGDNCDNWAFTAKSPFNGLLSRLSSGRSSDWQQPSRIPFCCNKYQAVDKVGVESVYVISKYVVLRCRCCKLLHHLI